MSQELINLTYDPPDTEIPKWGEPYPNILKKDSVLTALTDYILEVNFKGYKPDPRKVLAVRDSDRSAVMRSIATPARREVYYLIEGELFPNAGTTRLADNQTPSELAQLLTGQIFDRLVIWVAYDFVKGSPPGFRKPFDKEPTVIGSGNPNPQKVNRSHSPRKGMNPDFFLPDPVAPFHVSMNFVPDAAIEEFQKVIDDLILHDFRNVLPEGDNFPIFDLPVIGVASARDPIFRRFQDPEVEGPQLRLPEEWLPSAESVISFFLPYSKEIIQSSDKNARYSSLESASAKWNGSKFLNVARRALVRTIELKGGRAVAPNIDPRYDSNGWLPFWSERHTAFAAGLGTFGLQQSIITEKGVFGRLGSVITDLKIKPNVRPYTEIYEYCQYYFDGSCKICVDRCPSKAVTDAGKVPGICTRHGNAEYFKDWGYGACHHCSTFVPCSTGIPPKVKKTYK